MRPIVRTSLKLSAALGAAALILGYAGYEWALARLQMPSLARAEKVSPVVLAEDGSILSAYLAADGRWRLKTSTEDVPPQFLDMLLAYEDKRFFEHGGVDPLAAMRSAYLLLRHGRVVSGASTITMQTVRLLGEGRPGFLGKLRQSLLAIKLERALDKRQILSLYLTVAPYGGNIEGVRAAALQYFGKEPKSLSVAEAAYLVALPQSPERRRPRAGEAAVRAARDQVLTRMESAGVLTAKDVRVARGAPVASARGRYPMLARHLADRLRHDTPEALAIATPVDYGLQQSLETLSAELVAKQPDLANVALLVIRNSDLAVRAYVGGGAYFDRRRAGMFDLVRGIRSPGSALKPFIYGFAFEDLIVHPQTIVTDDNLRIRDYAPVNFDETYRGDLTTRQALVQSVNTVAVMLLEEVGADRFLGRLRHTGVSLDMPGGDTPPGLAIALGGVGISLEQLATLYAGLANHGEVRPLKLRAGDPPAPPSRLMSPEAAWAVADCLGDAIPPPGGSVLYARDGGRRVAFKTGTSYGFRDAWALGFDANYTVAVWIGRPDGNGRIDATGARTAVPVMMRIFDLLPNAGHDVAADRPERSILAQNGELPLRLRRHIRGNETQQPYGHGRPVEIGFPVNGSTIKLEKRNGAFAPFSLFARGGRAPFHWYVDGRALRNSEGDRVPWEPEGRGQVEFVVIDADGRSARATAWLD